MNEPYNLNSLWALNDHSKFIGQSRARDKAWSEGYCKKAVLMEMNPMVMVKLCENRRKDYYLKTKAKNNTARIMSRKWKTFYFTKQKGSRHGLHGKRVSYILFVPDILHFAL